MENNNIDKLFREQLMQHTVTPSPEAWKKLQQGMERKKKSFFFWMVAASLALVISVGLWLIPQNRATEMIAEQQSMPMPMQEEYSSLSQTGAPAAEVAAEAFQEENSSITIVDVQAVKTNKKETKIEAPIPRVETEIKLVQAEIRKPILDGFDPTEVVIPPHLEVPKRVIQSAGLEIEIYQNLTAPDSVKRATAAKKNLLRQVINAAIDVKSGELELNELIDLGKLRGTNVENRNN